MIGHCSWGSWQSWLVEKGDFARSTRKPPSKALSCKEDEAPSVWSVHLKSKEHRDHKTLPLEEASQEYKDQFCNHLEILKKERERIVGCKANVSKESKALLASERYPLHSTPHLPPTQSIPSANPRDCFPGSSKETPPSVAPEEAAMAAGGPIQELCKEASCSICLDFFRDPVMIPECGHSFCRACLTWSWGESQGAETSCPQCRGPAQEETLRPNQQLANFVEITQKLNPLEGRGQKRRRGICEKHQEPQKFICQEDDAPLCLVCSRSQEHKDHTVIPLEEAVEENRAKWRKFPLIQKAAAQSRMLPVGNLASARKESFLKEAPGAAGSSCNPARTTKATHPRGLLDPIQGAQKSQETLPLREASQRYKDHFCSCLEGLKKERERIVACKADVEKESQDLLKQATGEKQGGSSQIQKQLHSFLEEQEKLLLAQIEEVEGEVARNRDQHLTFQNSLEASPSPPSPLVESLIWEMEGEMDCCRSTLQSFHIWDFSDLNLFLESIKKQHKDILDSGLQLQKANVTLDPDTAHPILILSEDWKSTRDGGKAQSLPNNPERFDSYPVVLGCEGFTAGRHFWEVVVGSEGEWMLGVARKSVKRKGKFTLSPEEGIWAVGKWGGHCRAAIKGHNLPLTLRGELKRIRVCLNYDGGRVAFFDADRAALMYEFSGASFSGETLVPYFWVYKKGHLKLSS
uniref:Uncharacterized protein n=1 Tax=Sphaerodactylus townsendi TaxID=933632 RepID=A0ACB8EFZ7_9SAUR